MTSFALPAVGEVLLVQTTRGSDLHAHLVDAMLDADGFVLVDDEIHAIRSVTPLDEGRWSWLLTPSPAVGNA